MKKNLILVTLISGILITSLTACSGSNKKEEKTTETQEILEIPSESQTEVEETREGMLKSFFTGQWIDEKVAMQRPVAIMTENTNQCMPHYGLNRADVVYECPAEGGYTRFMAIYQDYKNEKKLGNIRSCRHYFCFYAKEFDAFYIHAGKSPKGEKLLKKGYIDHIDGSTGDGKYYYRDNSRKAPHNLYISAEQIDQAMKDKKYETTLKADYQPHYQFADEKEPVTLDDGIDAKVVSLYFFTSKPNYIYNEEDGLYYRSEFGQKEMDGIDNTQLCTKNIIIQNTSVEVLDDIGRVEVGVKGEGTGYYITNGKCIEITWKKELQKSGITHYYDKEGKEITINPGRTWVEICDKQHADKNKFYSSVEDFKAAK